ncbi:MAG: NlpC/P60 family protein [Mesorhizobium sp.]
MSALDRRLNAFRADLADERLRGVVDAARFATGRPAVIGVPVADLRSGPAETSGIDTQLLRGETVSVFDERDGYAWVQAARDGYVGYVALSALATSAEPATHIVSAPRTFAYPGPDIKLPVIHALSMGSALAVAGFEERRGTGYAVLLDGTAVIARHIRAIGAIDDDYVAVAEILIRTPYLWAGASAFGIDCSGLVQLSMHMAGKAAPRDSDMQAAGLGTAIDPAETRLRRGDLVFWKGHAAILTDAETIIHANGNTMDVALEPLDAAVQRIGYLYGQPTGYRRP